MHALKPSAMTDQTGAVKGEPKYSVSIIIPKADTAQLDMARAAIEEAKQNGKNSKFGGKFPANLKLPLRDGDTDRPDDAAYKDSFFVTASSAQKPGIVDRKKQEITAESEVYSGMYANVSVNFYPFNAAGSKGVACGLNHIQKVKDGEPLGGRGSADQDFEELEDEEGEADASNDLA